MINSIKNFSIVENTLKCKLLNEILEFLNSIKLSSNIEFVYSKGKRKTELQKLIEEANKYLERQSKYDLYNSIFNGRNSFSKTDIDATFMNMKDNHMKNAKLKSGYISKAKICECENCNDCPIKSKCTKAKSNKRIQISPVFITKRKQSQDNITSEFSILAKMNRSIQVEGAFGVIKENHNFRRFLTRGKKNVKVEFTLLALAYNLNKLHNKIQQNRSGVTFYTKAIA